MSRINNYYKGTERRKFPRASTRVIYTVFNQEYLGLKVYTKDISAGGMFFIASENIEPHTLLSLSITFPAGHNLQMKAKVLRKEEIRVVWSPKEQYRIAIEFIDLSETDRQKISACTKRHLYHKHIHNQEKSAA